MDNNKWADWHNGILFEEIQVNSTKRDSAMNAATGNALTVLFEMIAMNPGKNVLPRLPVSVKKAVLSLALERCNADKDLICSLLGLTDRQYDDAMYMQPGCV